MFPTYNELEKIDLHIHSCYSDGELTPPEIVEKWISEGYKTIAITDHDGIEGSRIGQEFSRELDIEFVTGIEFDSNNEFGYDFHILGYNIDLESPIINESIAEIYKWRCERNENLIKAINKLGYELTIQEVNALGNGKYIGKPTMAKALVARGYVSSISDAFSKIIDIASNSLDSRKKTFHTKHIIDVIHEAGGIAIFAHPIEQKKDGESWAEFKPRLFDILDGINEMGIDGIECYHPSADKKQSMLLVKYALAHGLDFTRGSDFHSKNLNRNYSKYHI